VPNGYGRAPRTFTHCVVRPSRLVSNHVARCCNLVHAAVEGLGTLGDMAHEPVRPRPTATIRTARVLGSGPPPAPPARSAPVAEGARQDRAWNRVVTLAQGIDRIYLDGRHDAMAENPMSMIMGVLAELEGRLASLHRLCLRLRPASEQRSGSAMEADLAWLRRLVDDGLGAAMSAGRQLEEERDAALDRSIVLQERNQRLEQRCDLQVCTIRHLRQRVADLEGRPAAREPAA